MPNHQHPVLGTGFLPLPTINTPSSGRGSCLYPPVMAPSAMSSAYLHHQHPSFGRGRLHHQHPPSGRDRLHHQHPVLCVMAPGAMNSSTAYAPSVVAPGAMSSSYAHHQHPVLWTRQPIKTRRPRPPPMTASINTLPLRAGRRLHASSSTPCPLGRGAAPIHLHQHSAP